jgi:membrane protease YdiL (CAAX protease family)
VLTAKPWKTEAIIRLLLSIFVCYLLGALVLSVARFVSADRTISPWIFGALVAGSVMFSLATLFVLHRPWDLAWFTRPFLGMLLCLYLGLTLGAFVQHFAGKPAGESPTVRTVVATLSFQGMALVFMWRFARDHGLGWREAFGFSVRRGTALLVGGLMAFTFLPVGWALQQLAIKLVVAVRLEPQLQPAVQALTHSVTWLDRAALGVVAIGLAPVAEEMLFRGILYPWLKNTGHPRFALWGTSLAFAAIHLNLVSFLPLLVLALALAWLYEKTGNLLAPITAHAVFNATEFTLFYLMPIAAQKFEWLHRFATDP